MIPLSDFSGKIIQSTPAEITEFISGNRNLLKLMFINLDITKDNTDRCSSILVHLGVLQLPQEEEESNEIQFLYKELGLYFKKANNKGLVSNCSNHLTENIFKNRLKSWLHHKLYLSADSHCKLFENYVVKLSAAITDGDEDYENDVLRDLHSYYLETVALLERLNLHELKEQFQQLFENDELIEKYQLLNIYQQNKHQFTAEVVIGEGIEKIYEPSVFAEELFEDKFLRYIRTHEDTVWYQVLLGYDTYTIRKKIINFGQAHFDNTYGSLTANDIVKLYSYFNMRKHYYSTLHLLERFNRIHNFHQTNGRIKFIDVGCGPATSAIALIDHLHAINGDSVSFDYFGVDYYTSMREEAANMMTNEVYLNDGSVMYIKRLGNIDYDLLSNANSIYINTCYLFASDSLDEEELAHDVMNIRRAKEDIPFYILFQNTTEHSKNVKYNAFKGFLGDFKVLFGESSLIRYNNRRNSYHPPTEETVAFEILELL
ncbi:hypothetical protein SAMN05421786_101569 [Chryseobacterium ureilyticum]|uniref:Methyltransferase domain-containing protein n=1 Tax=Chryseobacterium ureilyticum TaxID=373668 RepID=A0A1N7KKY9_9FLAO|nr:hypothetical protein [Chryseobacterium ureilyticum]SIS62281.1 hypothetical protein SAMN05421786_101569 [Chryseobacterium ureilyticum]